MAVVEGEIPLKNIGADLDAVQVTNSRGHQVLREATFIGDPEVFDNRANVCPITDQAFAMNVTAFDGALIAKRGNIPGMATFEKFGRNPDIDTAAGEDIWEYTGVYTGQPTPLPSELVVIVSTDAADDVGGTGLITIELSGQLNGIEQTEEVTLNGISGAVPTKAWDRIYRVRGKTAGSGGSNVGAILCQGVDSGAIYFVLGVGTNRSQISAYTVPADKTLYLKDVDFRIARSTGAAGSAVMCLAVRESLTGVYEQTLLTDVTVGGNVPIDVGYRTSYPAGTDLVGRVVSVSDNNTFATCHLSGVLIDN